MSAVSVSLANHVMCMCISLCAHYTVSHDLQEVSGVSHVTEVDDYRVEVM